MPTYCFTLRFSLPPGEADPDALADRLYRGGCSDGLVGLGRAGRVVIDFDRCARSAKLAMSSAVSQVTKAIPGAKLVDAGPDLVGATELSSLFACSRQNIHKHMTNEGFPSGRMVGNKEIFHLFSVLDWVRDYGRIALPAGVDAKVLHETAVAAAGLMDFA